MSVQFKPIDSVNSNWINHKRCPVCNSLVFGRRDKIFCSVKCKNEHHRIARVQFQSREELSHKRIRRNAVLLEGILGPRSNAMAIHRDELIRRGFDIKSCVRAGKNKGRVIYEIYDYQYFESKDGVVIVRRKQNLVDYLPGFFERYEVEFPLVKKEIEMIEREYNISLSNIFGRWDE